MPRRAPTPKHKPQSTDGPTQLELERDATLGEFMAKGVPLEDKSEIERRETVIGELTRVFREWVREVCKPNAPREEDGCFWMQWHDFSAIFDKLDVCRWAGRE